MTLFKRPILPALLGGKNPVLDRVWTIASLLARGFLAMLVAFDFWVN